jgi:hypothetical protein
MIKSVYPNFNPQVICFYPDGCRFTIDEKIRVYVNLTTISYISYKQLKVVAETNEPLFTREVVEVLDDIMGKV